VRHIPSIVLGAKSIVNHVLSMADAPKRIMDDTKSVVDALKSIIRQSPNLERGIYAASAWPCKTTLKRAKARAPSSN
jgi:hypothetical protein